MLVKNFETVFLPTFSTSEMLVGSLHSTTKRRMQGLCHYRFQQKLIHQCSKHGTMLKIVGEEYTTKTCGGCGCLKSMSGETVYECTKCSYTLDRDIHGARNILIKNCTAKDVDTHPLSDRRKADCSMG